MNLSHLKTGSYGTADVVVDASCTARTLGSGSEAVYATPAMIALMEAAAVACVEQALPTGCISLGTQIAVEHIAATAVGAHVMARAELTGIEGRMMHFSVTALEGEKLIGRGAHTRAVVDRERFLAKLSSGA